MYQAIGPSSHGPLLMQTYPLDCFGSNVRSFRGSLPRCVVHSSPPWGRWLQQTNLWRFAPALRLVHLLVAGLDRDAARKVAAADPRRPGAQHLDRPDQAQREDERTADDLVERIRRLVQTKPAVSNGMEAAS